MTANTLESASVRIVYWRRVLARDSRPNPFVAAVAGAQRLTRQALEELPLCEPTYEPTPGGWAQPAAVYDEVSSDASGEDLDDVSSAASSCHSTSSHLARLARLAHPHTRALAALAHCLSFYTAPQQSTGTKSNVNSQVNAFACLCGYLETSVSPTDECHRIATLIAQIVDRATRGSCRRPLAKKWARLLRRLRDENMVEYVVETVSGGKVPGEVYFAAQAARECDVWLRGRPSGAGGMSEGTSEFLSELRRFGFPV